MKTEAVLKISKGDQCNTMTDLVSNQFNAELYSIEIQKQT
jgi:hypothetical protein